MGIGPVPAIKAALNKAGKSLQDMALVEVCNTFIQKINANFQGTEKV